MGKGGGRECGRGRLDRDSRERVWCGIGRDGADVCGGPRRGRGRVGGRNDGERGATGLRRGQMAKKKKKAAKKGGKKGAKKSAKKPAAKKTTAKKGAKKGAKKKARRTTLRSSAGKKLYAVRAADGTFKDIQQYSRAHAADIRQDAVAEQPTPMM